MSINDVWDEASQSYVGRPASSMSNEQEKVEADTPEKAAISAATFSLDAHSRTKMSNMAFIDPDHLRTLLASHAAQAEEIERLRGDRPISWRKFGDEQPVSGSKIIAPYDDGSGAGMFFVYDGGVIDQDGDDYPRVPRGADDVWAYLPSGYVFYCEGYPEESVTLPDYVMPATSAEAKVTALTEEVERLRRALEPFSEMSYLIDDADDLVDDEDRKESVHISFGGMSMGEMERGDFRCARTALEGQR